MEILPVTNQYSVGFNNDKAAWSSNPVQWAGGERALTSRLEYELRAAKMAGPLQNLDVLLPTELLTRVARQVLTLAELEPCGARGAVVCVDVANERLTAFKLDPATVTTHELHLKLQHDATSWTNVLPQFLKNLTRGSTVIISPQFTLTKKKLYRSCQAE